MTADTDPTDREDDEIPTHRPNGLVETTGVNLREQARASGPESLDDSSLTPNNIISTRATRQLIKERNGAEDETHGDDIQTEPGQEVETRPNAECDAKAEEPCPVDREAEGEREAEEETKVEQDGQTAGEPKVTETHPETERLPDAERDGSPADRETELERTDVKPADEEAMVVTLNPLAVALAERSVATTNDGPQTVDALVTEAVHQYVLALLAGKATGDEKDRFSVDLTGSLGVEQAIDELVGRNDEFTSTAALVAKGMATALGGTVDQTVKLRDSADYREYLDAVVRNASYVFDSQEEVVEAAIIWHLAVE